MATRAQDLAGCRVAASPILDPISAFVASLDRAVLRAENSGDTSCLAALTAGSEQSRALTSIATDRARHRGMTLMLRSVVAQAAQAGTFLNPDCSTVLATVVEDISYRLRGASGKTISVDHRVIHDQLTLRDLAYNPNSAPSATA